MADKRRNIGREILQGIRQLKRGKRGEVSHVAASDAMKTAKRRRLKRAGWTVAGGADFLRLSPREARLIETKVAAARGPRPRKRP